MSIEPFRAASAMAHPYTMQGHNQDSVLDLSESAMYGERLGRTTTGDGPL